MKRIALVNPDSPFLENDGDRPPLNLAYLASAVREKHEVKIFDFAIGNHKKLLNEIMDFRPEIIGFTATTPIISRAINLYRTISYMADFKFVSVIGGVHATLMPEFCSKYFDHVFVGEVEYSFARFCDFKVFPKQNIITSSNIYDIDGLIPSRDLLPMNKYSMTLNGEKCAPIITSRGCPYNCIYCSNIHGKKVRLNSAVNVVLEMQSIRQNYGIESFYFLDDVFTIDKKRVLEICELIHKWTPGISFRVTTRINLVDVEILDTLKHAGCKMVCYGLESGSDRVLKLYNKKFNVADIKRVVKMTRELGIAVRGFWMTSFLENEEDKKATKDLMWDLGLQNNDVYNLTVYPGSELWKKRYGDRQDFDRNFFDNLYHGGKK